MNLTDLCIRRPVFATMLTMLPIVLGIASYTRLGVDLYPNLELPYVTVSTTLAGASPEEVETQITRPLEEVLNTCSSVDELRSTTSEGMSRIFVRFRLEKNPDAAAAEVRDKVGQVLRQLPPGTDPPIIDKFDSDSVPILTLAIGGKRDFRELTEIVRRRIKEVIETLPGVGAVSLNGGRRRAIQITIDTDKLQAYELSVEDVRRSLAAQNLEMPGGRVDAGARELVLRTMGRIEDPSRFSELIVATRNGYPVRLGDIGRAADMIEEPRGLVRLDGTFAVSLVIQKQSGVNTVAVAETVKTRLADLARGLPEDIEIQVVRDQARFIRRSINEVEGHLLLAALLVSGTILLFIHDWRTTLIASVAIPASVVTTFLFMNMLGFTLNNITMLALVLSIGIVIDDAVVVHENIFRHMEESGLDAVEASRRGTREIALAVLATSLSLVVIFLPVAFMEGRIGRLFHSFGLTIAFAILVSLFVSFTLTPMLCSRFLKLHRGAGGALAASSKSHLFYRVADRVYAALLGWSLRHRGVVLLLAAAVTASTVPLYRRTSLDYMPRDDQSEFDVLVITPPGATLARADELFREIEARLRTLPEVVHLLTTIGDTTGRSGRGQGDVTRGSIYVRLSDLEQRATTQFDVMRRARLILDDYPDLRSSVSDVNPASSGNSGGSTLDFHLLGPDLARLHEYSDKLLLRLRAVPGLVDVDTTLVMRKPELRVLVNRARAADLNIPVRTVASALQLLVGGAPISTYKEEDEQYDVWLRAEAANRGSELRIQDITLPSPTAGLVPLSNIAELREEYGPSQIERYNRQRKVTISANLDNMALGDAIQAMRDAVRSLDMPPEYDYRFGGRARSLEETISNFAIAFGLSLVFMYMVLAAQFESFVDPVTILLALPVTVPFALLSLLLLRQPMDIYAIFGLFMLVGIVKKNGILQIDYIRVLRRRGVQRTPAILEANRTRLRPILMTTVMLVAGMIPIALGRGPGSASRASLAKVIIGGQALSLLLTLVVTPVAYSVFDDIAAWLARPRRSRQAAPAAPAETLLKQEAV